MPGSVVRDSFLGYFVGLVDSDATGFADAAYLHEVLPEFVSFHSLAFEDILRIVRERDAGGATVAVELRSELDFPIPFRILWDTPGTIRASRRIVLRETRVPAVTVPADGGEGLELAPTYVYEIVEGRFSIDFDRWIDVLLGGAVDDIDVSRLLVFRVGDRWYGALMGAGYEGQLVAGYFDFRDNRILVPVPRRWRRIGALFFAAGAWEGR
jgi:hypothetical protein